MISDCSSPGPAWLKVSEPLGPPRQARRAAVAVQEANRGLWAASDRPGRKRKGLTETSSLTPSDRRPRERNPRHGLKASETPRSRRHRLSPAQQGPAQGPLPKGGSQSFARPSGPAPEGTVSRPPSHSYLLRPGPQGFVHLSPLTTRSAPGGGGGGGGGGGAARAGSGAAMLGPGLG